MSSYCIICYRLCLREDGDDRNTTGAGSNTDTVKDNHNDGKNFQADEQQEQFQFKNSLEQETTRRFFTLLKRYVLEGTSGCGENCPKTNISGKVFQVFKILGGNGHSGNCCSECLAVMESFCELYKELKGIELLLNWKLGTLVNIMFCAQRVRSRVDCFRQNFQTEGNCGDYSEEGALAAESVLEQKKTLVKLCLKQLSEAFPKVKLKRKLDLVTNTPTAPQQPVTSDPEHLNLSNSKQQASVSSEESQLEVSHEKSVDIDPQLTEVKLKRKWDAGTTTPTVPQPVTSDPEHPDLSESKQQTSVSSEENQMEVSHEESTDTAPQSPGLDEDDTLDDGMMLEDNDPDPDPQTNGTQMATQNKVDQSNVQGGRGRKEGFYRFQCPHNDCDEQFRDIPYLLTHIDSQHGNSTLTGSVDEQLKVNVYDSQSGVIIFTVKLPSKSFRCPKCKRKTFFYSESGLQAHLQLHGSFSCETCSKKFQWALHCSSHEIMGHKRHRSKNITCSRCPNKYIKEYEAVGHHIRDHLKLPAPKYHHCPICKTELDGINIDIKKGGKPHYNLSVLIPHFRSHHDLLGLEATEGEASLHLCQEKDCGAYFLTEQQLSEHLGKCTGSTAFQAKPEEEYLCRICNWKIMSRSNLQSHRTHIHRDDPRLKQCGYGGSCDFLYETEEEIGDHRQKFHDNPVVHQCPKCGKYMSTESHLRQHLEYHKREEAGLNTRTFRKNYEKQKSHQCEICGKGFPCQSKLKIHYAQHQTPEEWEWQCETCARKFQSKQKLQYHQNSHDKNKERKFACHLCPSRFSYNHHLRTHIRDKHGEEELANLPKLKVVRRPKNFKL